MNKDLRNRFIEQARAVRQTFGDGEDLHADQAGLSPSVRQMLRESMERHEALTALYNELDRVGVGLILKHWSGNQWALVLPDASEPGKFRYQAFGLHGWITHHTCTTLDEVVSDAFCAGFRMVASPDTLDRVASTVEWKKGCERLEFITRHNCGEISYREMLDQFQNIDAKYASAA